MLAFIEEHFAEFLTALNHLPKFDLDMLLAYCVLGVRQDVLGPLFGISQTQSSTAIREAMKRLSLFLTIGKPSQTKLAPIFKGIGVEHVLSVPLSHGVIALARLRSCFYTEKFHDLPESCLSSTIQRAIKRLAEGTTDPGWSAAWLDWLLFDHSESVVPAPCSAAPLT